MVEIKISLFLHINKMDMINKKSHLTILLITFLSVSNTLFTQDSTPGGKPIARIFADYKQQLNSTTPYHGFGLTRAFFGYDYNIDNRLSARVLIDVGSPLSTDELSAKRYSYLRNAYISYRVEDFSITLGITDGLGHAGPNDFWAKRYISKPFLLQNNYMKVADIGLIADYRLSPIISFDAQIFNGEGYTNIQNDNSLLFGAGITIKPSEELTFRLFGDIYNQQTVYSNTIASFAGYKNSRFSLGLEYNYKTNINNTLEHHIFGFSTMASYYLSQKFELFGRYDLSSSVIPPGDIDQWNILNDGSLIITGLQFTHSQYLRISLNYQGWSPISSTVPGSDYIQINVDFKF
jgi:hypothetical protein